MRKNRLGISALSLLIALLMITLDSCFYFPLAIETETSSKDIDSAITSDVSDHYPSGSPIFNPAEMIQYPQMESDSLPINQYEIQNGFAPLKKETYYFRNQLSPQKQKIYDVLLYYIERYDTRWIYAPDLNGNQFIEAMNLIYLDNPQLFWLSEGGQYEYNADEKTFKVDYLYTKDQVIGMQKALDSETSKLMANLTASDSQYAVEVDLHDALVQSCTYDADDCNGNNSNIYGALVDHRPVCSGYSKAMQYLLNQTGIQCLYITGAVNASGHAWNMACIDGSFYYLDVTWDDSDEESSSFVLHDYFNLPSENLLKERSIDSVINPYGRNYSLPECTDTSLNYYTHEGTSFSQCDAAFYSAVKKYIVKKLRSKQFDIELVFTNTDAYNKAVKELFDEEKLDDILLDVCDQCGDIIDTYSGYSFDDRRIIAIHLS